MKQITTADARQLEALLDRIKVLRKHGIRFSAGQVTAITKVVSIVTHDEQKARIEADRQQHGDHPPPGFGRL